MMDPRPDAYPTWDDLTRADKRTEIALAERSAYPEARERARIRKRADAIFWSWQGERKLAGVPSITFAAAMEQARAEA